MSYQFLHVESYARTPGKGKAGGHSLASIVAEAEREPGACPHIPAPRPPTIIYGSSPAAAAAKAEEWAEQAKDTKGRKLRKDGLCLLAGVASFPREQADADPAAYQAWRTDTVAHLVDEYGDRLQCVLEHTDEEHPHLHFYCVPRPGERFDDMHAGRRAAAAAKATGALKGAQNTAYQDAMRAMQDRYYERVAMRHGMSRLGPGRRRLSRQQWQAEQAQARALQDTQTAAERVKAEAEAEAEAVRQKAAADAAEALARARTDAEAKLAAAEAAEAAAAAALADAELVAAEKAAAAEQSRKDAVNDANEIRIAARLEAIEEAKKMAEKGFNAGKQQALDRFSGLGWLRGQIREITGKADVEARANALQAKLQAAEQKVVKRETEIEGLRATVQRKEELRRDAQRELDEIKNPPKPQQQNRPDEPEPANRNRPRPR
jgi:hypothetical protein